MSKEKNDILKELEESLDIGDFSRKSEDSYQPETDELDDDNPPSEDSDSE